MGPSRLTRPPFLVGGGVIWIALKRSKGGFSAKRDEEKEAKHLEAQVSPEGKIHEIANLKYNFGVPLKHSFLRSCFLTIQF